MHSAPKVCVIIPAYNQACYLPQAIQSVLEQTYTDFELIVVDDGSTDETPQVLARIHDPRIRVIHQPNAGLSAARNTGLRKCTAPIITFLDADDFFYPDKLEVLVGFLESHPEIGMVSGGTQIVDHNGQALNQMLKDPGCLDLPALLLGNPFPVTAILVRKLWFDVVGLFDESLRACEDWDLWQRMVYAGCKFAWVEHIVVAYRYHPAQMTREPDRMRKALLTVLDKFFSQPDLPEKILRYKNAAYASALLHAAGFAYHAQEYDKGQRDLAEAIRLDPTLAEDNYKKLVGALVGWSQDPRTSEPAAYIRRIIENPPPGHIELKQQLYQAMADVLLGAFYEESRKNWRLHRKDLCTVIRYKPVWLLNRGFLRILAEAWLPFN